MEFDLIYPNYNKQKRKTKKKATNKLTNKKTWLTTTEVQPYLHGSRFDVGKKHKYIYVIRNITPSCRQNQATLC